MSKFNHTPGPWRVLESEVHRPYLRIRGTCLGGRYKIANVLCPQYENIHDRESDETIANARLMAAAPDMLGALIEAYKFYLEAIDDYGPCDHAVNICVCGLKGQAEEIKEIIESATGLPIEEVLK